MNPPFPYHVNIKRREPSSDPFLSEEEAFQEVYNGVCDYESNNYPLIKDGVQLGKYNLYLPDRKTPIRKQDIIELSLLNGEIIIGTIVDYIPTNFGLTIKWDNVNN